MNDPIVEEVRARGRALSERYRHDPRALLQALREQACERPMGVVETIRVVHDADAGIDQGTESPGAA